MMPPETRIKICSLRERNGDQIHDWNKIPEGTRVLTSAGEGEQSMERFLEIGKDGATARALAGDPMDRDTTIFFFPDGLIRTGRELKSDKTLGILLDRTPQGTRVLAGYIYGGFVRSRRPPSSIAGIKWTYPSTFYRLPDGRIVSGDDIDDSAIPVNTLVFYRN
jgi:hypothetical protein